MKALSIHPYYAMAIIEGQKDIEVRSWKTDYRGDILICSTAKKFHGTIPGHALGVVTLFDIVPMKKGYLNRALMDPKEYKPGQYAWILTNNRPIVPKPVKGKLSLWDYDDDIEYIKIEPWMLLPDDAEPGSDEDDGAFFNTFWKPLCI